MSGTSKNEEGIYQAAKSGLTRWLARAKTAVLAPFERFKAQPNPSGVLSVQPAWQPEVDRILAELNPVLREAWAAAHLPGDYDPRDPFIQANLALTRNLLVRIPDEVHSLVVAQILEGVNAGETNDQIASRIDHVLTFTDSERWDHRARLIARTELTRHFGSSMLAHGLLVERQDNTPMIKTWHTIMDTKEREDHHLTNGQERPLSQPFTVGASPGVPMMFPGDPEAPADQVCACRCFITLKKVTA